LLEAEILPGGGERGERFRTIAAAPVADDADGNERLPVVFEAVRVVVTRRSRQVSPLDARQPESPPYPCFTCAGRGAVSQAKRRSDATRGRGREWVTRVGDAGRAVDAERWVRGDDTIGRGETQACIAGDATRIRVRGADGHGNERQDRGQDGRMQPF